MPLSPNLEKMLNKIYPPQSTIDNVYNGKDITFKTNEHGEPVTLFIGQRRPDGAITGERYVRTIKREPNSNQIKSSHWDLKGKVTRG